MTYSNKFINIITIFNNLFRLQQYTINLFQNKSYFQNYFLYNFLFIVFLIDI